MFLSCFFLLVCIQKAAEIIWKGSFQSDYFICKWVTKSQLPGMERSSFEAVIPIINSAFRILFFFAVTHFQTRSRIVHRISQKRVTYPCHVNPDLMGSSGFQLKLNKSHVTEIFYVFIIRNCIPASWQQSIWRNCHFHGIFRIRGKWYSNFFPEYRIICF